MSKICRAGYLLTSILIVAALLSFLPQRSRGSDYEAIPENTIPMKIGNYTGISLVVPEETKRTLKPAQVIDRQYNSINDGSVDFALVFGENRDALHDPRACLLGAGGTIADDREEILTEGIKVRSCRVTFSGERKSSLQIIYFYLTREGIVSSPTKIRSKLLWDSLALGRKEPVYFLRFVIQDDGSAETHQKLRDFVCEAWSATHKKLMKRLFSE